MNIKSILRKVGFEIEKIPPYGRLHVRYRYFQRIYDSIKNIDGDIVECGVGYGRSFLTLTSLMNKERKDRAIWGFDSFEGFPEISKHDKSERNIEGDDKLNYCSREKIIKLLQENDISSNYIRDNVRLVKGYLKDTLPGYSGNQIALLHLDVDLYESYKVALEILWPLVADGGVVMFDEYKDDRSLKNFPGAAKAIDEFFSDNVKFIRMDGQANRYYLYKQGL